MRAVRNRAAKRAMRRRRDEIVFMVIRCSINTLSGFYLFVFIVASLFGTQVSCC